jgi:exodeoxyribonuclease VII small subunit
MDDAEKAQAVPAGKGRPRRKTEELQFEQSLKRLEEIVRRLEDEQIPLEESLRLFTEGKKLAKLCEAQLQRVENRVRQLIEDAEGQITEVPLDPLTPQADGEDAGDEVEAPSAPSRSRKDDLPF